ncbi:hypothetical protein [Streptomyces sp. NBC_01431]|uniref:hypothetical protein n=1 Tax=Streptomyces sp. NBC_01431 TaxID=2903863 RepID=UPI002E37122B|nr:hypothetical protein [Streptomyces sp. NBC_01431]
MSQPKQQTLGPSVVAAPALPYYEKAPAPPAPAVDYDRYAEHCRGRVDNGCHGVGPNDSLSEYASLTEEEHHTVARTRDRRGGRQRHRGCRGARRRLAPHKARGRGRRRRAAVPAADDAPPSR